MNAATLARIRVVSGTAEELIQTIKEVSKQQRFPGLIESAIYLVSDSPDEIFALAMWDSLNSIPNFEENYKRPVNREVVARAQVLSRGTYRLVKEHRTVSTTIRASHLRLLVIPTLEPQTRLRQMVRTLNQLRQAAAGAGHIGYWLGRLAQAEPENRLTLLIRHDWCSLEQQRAFQHNPLVQEVRAHDKAEGAKVEFASFDLSGLVQLEPVELIRCSDFEL
jgi:heme-degrading monooxygenase HmoA